MKKINLSNYGVTLLRISLGIIFIAHAHLKYFTFTLPGTAQFFASLGLPSWLGYVVFTVELLGGLMLVLGVYTRFAALALIPVALGATWAHFPNGWLFTNSNGGFEYPALLAIATITLFTLGGGAFVLKKDKI